MDDPLMNVRSVAVEWLEQSDKNLWTDFSALGIAAFCAGAAWAGKEETRLLNTVSAQELRITTLEKFIFDIGIPKVIQELRIEIDTKNKEILALKECLLRAALK